MADADTAIKTKDETMFHLYLDTLQEYLDVLQDMHEWRIGRWMY